MPLNCACSRSSCCDTTPARHARRFSVKVAAYSLKGRLTSWNTPASQTCSSARRRTPASRNPAPGGSPRVPVGGQFLEQREHHFGSDASDKHAAAQRRISFSCSSNRIRFFASRNSAASARVTPGQLPSSMSAVSASVANRIPRFRSPLRPEKSGRRSSSRRQRRRDGTPEESLRHDKHLCQDRDPHKSGVNQTDSSPPSPRDDVRPLVAD
jgi:hypothetical protein